MIKKYAGMKAGISIALCLALILSLFGINAAMSFAADELKPVEISYWSSDDVGFPYSDAQEYTIVKKGETPDWKSPVAPEVNEDGDFARYAELEAATEYEIYTKLKDAADKTAVATEVLTSLAAAGINFSDDHGYVVGSTIEAEPDPAVEGLSYQWSYFIKHESEDGFSYTSETEDIEGATSAVYEIGEKDHGKLLAVKIMKGDKELMTMDDLGPVMTVEEVEAMMAEEGEDEGGDGGGFFTDVDQEAWYAEGVTYCYVMDYMTGSGDGTFAPNDLTSRAMIVQILYNMEGRPEIEQSEAEGFSDVSPDAWYADAVSWAAANDIVSGIGGGKFDPSGNITREQFAKIFYGYALYKGQDVSVGEDTNILSYEDVFDLSEWAHEAMRWAVGADIINGKPGGRLDPKGSATRAEAATMIMRYATM